MTYTRYDVAGPRIGPAGGSRQPSGVLQQVYKVFVKIGDAFERWSNRRAIYKMMSFDNRTLQDIGITRADVEWALSLPGDVDVSTALNDLVQRRRNTARWTRDFPSR